jgi:hypothetical protein
MRCAMMDDVRDDAIADTKGDSMRDLHPANLCVPMALPPGTLCARRIRVHLYDQHHFLMALQARNASPRLPTHRAQWHTRAEASLPVSVLLHTKEKIACGHQSAASL